MGKRAALRPLMPPSAAAVTGPCCAPPPTAPCSGRISETRAQLPTLPGAMRGIAPPAVRVRVRVRVSGEVVRVGVRVSGPERTVASPRRRLGSMNRQRHRQRHLPSTPRRSIAVDPVGQRAAIVHHRRRHAAPLHGVPASARHPRHRGQSAGASRRAHARAAWPPRGPGPGPGPAWRAPVQGEDHTCE
eukprot:scaffold84933_cov55-Phaeocystis_antarctica.AAC.3